MRQRVTSAERLYMEVDGVSKLTQIDSVLQVFVEIEVFVLCQMTLAIVRQEDTTKLIIGYKYMYCTCICYTQSEKLYTCRLHCAT